MNKKANLKEVVVYVLLALVVFSLTFVFINWVAGQSAFYEQIYAKKIGLLIDKSKSGSEINYDISELYKRAGKNGFKGKIIDIDNDKNNVKVMLNEGGGYDFNYFNSANVVWKLEDEWLRMKIVEKT